MTPNEAPLVLRLAMSAADGMELPGWLWSIATSAPESMASLTRRFIFSDALTSRSTSEVVTLASRLPFVTSYA